MKQKEGISLIVLVVTIIVMIIISGAVIISLTNSNIIDMGENAVQKHNQKSIEEAINLAYQDLMVTNLGKVQGYEFVERLETLSETYTEIQNITPGNGKVYYTLSLTGKEYQISTSTGEIKEYIDSYETVEGHASDWIRSGNTITGYKGENLKDVIVPNVLKDENGNEVKITAVSLKGIDFQGKLTISNNLYINSGCFSDAVNIKEVIIGNNVSMHFDDNNDPSFKGCTNLVKVKMGKNIKFDKGTHLGAGEHNLFYECPNLKEVTIESIANTAKWTFKNLKTSLKGEITIDEGVTEIGAGVFSGCKNITSINLPSTLKAIGGSAFNGCISVRNEIILADSITNIGESAFVSCPGIQGELILKDNMTLGAGAFNYCTGITNLKVGKGINIGLSSFVGCTNLKEVEIGNGVSFEIKNLNGSNKSTFSNCINLEKVTMGENIKFEPGTSVGSGANDLFYECPNLNEVTIKSIANTGKWIFKNLQTALKGEITIDEGVTEIGAGVFSGCKNITSINLPSTLKTVNNSAFNGCTGVQNFSINMTAEAFANVTKGSNWNTGIPVDITYIEAATN